MTVVNSSSIASNFFLFDLYFTRTNAHIRKSIEITILPYRVVKNLFRTWQDLFERRDISKSSKDVLDISDMKVIFLLAYIERCNGYVRDFPFTLPLRLLISRWECLCINQNCSKLCLVFIIELAISVEINYRTYYLRKFASEALQKNLRGKSFAFTFRIHSCSC